MNEREAIAKMALVVGGMLEVLALRLEYHGANTGAMRDELASIHHEMTREPSRSLVAHFTKSIGPMGQEPTR